MSDYSEAWKEVIDGHLVEFTLYVDDLGPVAPEGTQVGEYGEAVVTSSEGVDVNIGGTQGRSHCRTCLCYVRANPSPDWLTSVGSEEAGGSSGPATPEGTQDECDICGPVCQQPGSHHR